MKPELERYHFSGMEPEFFTCLKREITEDFSPYLTREYLTDVNERYPHLAQEPFEALMKAAESLRKDAALCKIASYCRAVLFESGYNEDYLCHIGFPKPDTGDQLLDDFFGLLVHLSGISVVEQRYAARGIPLSYMEASYNSVRIWVNSFHDFYGKWGHNREKPRMVYIEHLRIIRIGRLEFETNWFFGKVIVLQNRKTGDAALLSEGGLPVRQDGYLSGTNHVYDPECFYTFFDETEEAYCGHLITEQGTICRKAEELDKKDWRVVARRGQYSLNMHIPKDGKLDVQWAAESVREAERFYRKYFPDRPFRVFECHSWLFDPHFPKMLGDRSNIVNFQKLFTVFPEEKDDLGALMSVFSEAPFDLMSWVPTTSFQRKIQEMYRESSDRLFAAAGVIIPGEG